MAAVATAFGALLVVAIAPSVAQTQSLTKPEIAARLAAAYPDDVAGGDGDDLVFRDGTRLPIDDGLGDKPLDAWLATPDIEDMFRFAYPAGAVAKPPVADPGRARNAAFFQKIYGDCRKGETDRHLVEIAWLPGRSTQTIKVTSRNGVAEKFKAVTAELAQLPPPLLIELKPSAGAYVCRSIAGTATPSAHGYGIAVDIAVTRANYWRWDARGGRETPAFRNAISSEIVAIFEKHGFIWGGRWRHYDTMHFEYRPELISQRKAATAQ
ncbi:MAG: M15 family metallopeptidase [Hyphomicrobium sp.]